MTTQTIPFSTKCIRTEAEETACSFPNNSTVFTNAPKSGKRRPNKTITERRNAEILSIAFSMLNTKQLESHVNGLFEGEMAHLSFDIKKPLRDELNLVARERGVSVCKILNQLALAYIVAHHTKEHAISNTKSSVEGDSRGVVIESLNFTQNVQSRPRRLLRSVEVEGVEDSCEIGDCRRPAVDLMVYSRKGEESVERMICAFHSSEFAKCKEWSFKR